MRCCVCVFVCVINMQITRLLMFIMNRRSVPGLFESTPFGLPSNKQHILAKRSPLKPTHKSSIQHTHNIQIVLNANETVTVCCMLFGIRTLY